MHLYKNLGTGVGGVGGVADHIVKQLLTIFHLVIGWGSM